MIILGKDDMQKFRGGQYIMEIRRPQTITIRGGITDIHVDCGQPVIVLTSGWAARWGGQTWEETTDLWEGKRSWSLKQGRIYEPDQYSFTVDRPEERLTLLESVHPNCLSQQQGVGRRRRLTARWVNYYAEVVPALDQKTLVVYEYTGAPWAEVFLFRDDAIERVLIGDLHAERFRPIGFFWDSKTRGHFLDPSQEPVAYKLRNDSQISLGLLAEKLGAVLDAERLMC